MAAHLALAALALAAAAAAAAPMDAQCAARNFTAGMTPKGGPGPCVLWQFACVRLDGELLHPVTVNNTQLPGACNQSDFRVMVPFAHASAANGEPMQLEVIFNHNARWVVQFAAHMPAGNTTVEIVFNTTNTTNFRHSSHKATSFLVR